MVWEEVFFQQTVYADDDEMEEEEDLDDVYYPDEQVGMDGDDYEDADDYVEYVEAPMQRSSIYNRISKWSRFIIFIIVFHFVLCYSKLWK